LAAPSRMNNLEKTPFIEQMTELISELNAIHPFLEGNGRTIRAYSYKLCEAAGYDFSVSNLKGNTWNKASEQAFFGNTDLLKSIISRNVTK